MGDFITNESSFLTSAKRGYPADSPENSPRRRALLPRRHATAGRDSHVGTRRLVVTGEPAVALSRRRSRSGAMEGLWWCAFAHGRLPGGGPAAGAAARPSRSAARRRRLCPAAALSEGTRQALDQTTRPLCPRTVAAARCSSARPGRRVPPRAMPATPGGLFETGYRRADSPASSTTRRFEAKLH